MSFTPLALSLPATVPFVGPEALERQAGRPFKARLGANESVFGPSPAVIEAMCRAAGESWAYGDAENLDVRNAIAAHHAVRPENVVVGEGIDGLLGLLVRLTVAPGDAVVSSKGAYPTFHYHVVGHGGILDLVPYRNDDHEDLDALLDRARAIRPKLLYIANPDNPTGTWHEAEALQKIMDGLPKETLLVLDEAYSDFAPPSSLPALEPFQPNVIRFRTFSKAYGMAGARIGYGLGAPETLVHFNKVRNHFGLSRMAQAGAVAALTDQDYLRRTVQRVSESRERLAGIARSAGLRPLASATNFIAIDCGRDGAYARKLLEGVLEQGVFIRMPGHPPLDRFIRVTTGTPDDLALFETALTAVLQAN